jgi:hypothetical protein
MGAPDQRRARAAPATRDGRLDAIVAAAALLLVAGGLLHASLVQRGFLAQHPQNLAWIALSLAAGASTFFLNGRVALGGRVLLWTGYGTFAMLAGFNLQGLVNGTIVRLVPTVERGALVYLVLGVGAGLCQTVGKWLMIALAKRVHQPHELRDVLAIGLAVGLGFGLSEVVYIGTRLIEAGTPITGLGLIGVWERAAAVGFHVYSGGLVALALYRRRAWPIVLVLAVHSLEDWLAGAVGARVFVIPVLALESFYTAASAATWLAFRRATAPSARPSNGQMTVHVTRAVS